ncbi:MAG: phosphotransferase family protein [Acidimicrobiia bacterium]|nr:phosphotransferase family protein [Acidimicrobiia bacterium]MCY4435251.1 phosphotransferase family protein [bacterium]
MTALTPEQTAGLADWFGCGVVGVEARTGGLSWDVFTVDLDGGERVVIKRAPSHGTIDPYDVHKEVAVHQAAASAGIPVPEMVGACDDAGLIGEPFFAMAHVDADFPHLAQLDNWLVWQTEAGRRQVAEQIVDVMGKLHRLDWTSAGLPEMVTGPLGASGAELMVALVNRWMGNVERDVYPAFAPVPILRDAARFLLDHASEMPEAPPVLSHGDYRIGNLAFRGEELVAVLDWERAAVGPPLLDLGFFCHPLSRRRHPELMGMLVAWDELAALYTAATGTEPDPKWVHYSIIYWVFVESAVVPRGLALTVEGKMRSWPAFTQIPLNTENLAHHINAWEAGDTSWIEQAL